MFKHNQNKIKFLNKMDNKCKNNTKTNKKK